MELFVTILCIIIGTIYLFYHEEIIKFQGESKNISYKNRKAKFIIGGIFLFIFAFYLFFRTYIHC